MPQSCGVYDIATNSMRYWEKEMGYRRKTAILERDEPQIISLQLFHLAIYTYILYSPSSRLGAECPPNSDVVNSPRQTLLLIHRLILVVSPSRPSCRISINIRVCGRT